MAEIEQGLSFDNLTSTQFEEFCYDLLRDMGFVNLNWRKGTGHDSSPSDQGRDIQCELEVKDVDGQKYMETWFVECKHHKKGIPPAELGGALSWADAEQPDKLLIIASNYLSNLSKENLEKRQGKASYRIKYWENKQLQDLTLGKGRTALLMKYELLGELPFVKLLHPAHLLFLRKVPLNTLDYFFEVLDSVDPNKRNTAMDLAFHTIIQPRYREPISGSETRRERLIDEISFRIFKERCQELTKYFPGEIIVFLCLHLTLWQLFHSADMSRREELIDSHEYTIEYSRKRISEKPGEAKDLENLIQKTQEWILNVDENLKENYKLYNYFCTQVVLKMLVEPRHSRLPKDY